MNVSELQSYYADMPELQFHQMMQDVEFFAHEFNDPVFEFQNTFSNLVSDYKVDPEPEVHARTSIQSAENLIEPEWMYNTGKREFESLGDSGQITDEDYDSETSCSEYYSCEEEDGSEQVLGHFDKIENVLNLLHEISQSPAVQSFADFVPECVVPFYTPEPVKGTVLFDEGVSVQEDHPRGKSELSKDASPSFDNEEPLPIDLPLDLHVEHDKSIPECGLDDCAFWSILTDTVSYYQKDNLSSLVLESDSIEVQDTYYTDAKDMYFCAANNNIPNVEKNNNEEENIEGNFSLCFEEEIGNNTRENFESKEEYFMAAHCNEPELNKRYPVTTSIKNVFDPGKCVATTYLWSEESAISENRGIFDMGKIAMKMDSTVQGTLLTPDETKMEILIDSGATRALLNRDFYYKTPSLHDCPKYRLARPALIRTPDKTHMVVQECIDLLVKIQGHVFKINAYILPHMDTSYDMILGQKPMYELEAGPDFGTLTFTFMKRSLGLATTKTIVIPPRKWSKVSLEIRGCPKEFRNGKAVCNMITNFKKLGVQTMFLPVKNGKVQLQMENNTEFAWKIPTNSICGSIDMRSVGFFMIKRERLERVLVDSQSANFLTEDETMQYYKMVVQEVHDATLDRNYDNTKLKPRYDRDTSKINQTDGVDLYPWLEKNDPRREMTDEEILKKYVDLKDSKLTSSQKKELVSIMIKYKKAFSLRDEIGTCPKMEVELELTDKKPFFIRPYPCSESDKDHIDAQMKKGCLLGILKKGMTSYSSPIMLIPRKQGGIPRIVTDFRHLNSRLVVLQPSIPLVRDAIQIIGASGCEVISLIDLRDAYHTLPLSEESKKYCGITPYYGSSTYIYQRLGMGLSVSPAIWQNFIQTVLEEIPDYRKHYLAIMDDIMIHSKISDHMGLIVKLFKALIRNGLKISPKKCQLFKTNLIYMGHTMLIEEGLPKLKPLKTRVEAILKLDPPKTIKDCRSFCGMVNYLSIYLKDLQTKLIPIYYLTRKGVPFIWGEEQKEAFQDIKIALTSPPILVMPDTKGHIILVSDTSKVGCGGALYQEIRLQYRLISYCSKKLPEAVQRYSISELELTGLLANISVFKHILKNVKFTVFCDHSALVYIINAKRELPTMRLKKLIENLNAYCFVIRFLKGKEMHISDFLSRHPIEDGESPFEIIPIAFSLIEEIMRIEINEEGKLYWATDMEQDIVYINSLKNAEVVNFFMSIYQDIDEVKVDKEEILCTQLCNNENNLEDKPIRKSFNELSNEKIISNPGDIDENNHTLLTTQEIVDPVAKAIRKSPEQDIELQSLSQTETNCLLLMPTKRANLQAELASEITQKSEMSINPTNLKANSASEISTESVAKPIRKSLVAHVEFESEPENNILVDFGKTEDREDNGKLQCYVAATRSRSRQSDEKVPDIFPLHGEHRRPEHISRPARKEKDPVIAPQVDLPPPQPQPQPPMHIDPPPVIPQHSVPVQDDKYDPFKVPEKLIVPHTVDMPQHPVPQLPPISEQFPSQNTFVRNVPFDPIAQHTDLRTKPKVYESLIKPVPVDVQLQGTLPPFDVDKLWSEYDWEQPDKIESQQRKPLFKHIPDYQIFRAHIPKAAELRKFMKHLKSKVIHDYHLPMSVKELRAEYPTSPAFKDIYSYVTNGRIHLFGSAARKFKQQCEDFVVMSGVLFKIRYDSVKKGEPSLVLCVPEKYLPTILHQYHDSILAGHPGIVKLYEKLKRKYYFPGLLTLVHQYVKSCIECESTKPKLNEPKVNYPRIPLDYRPMARFSMDVKHMTKSKLGYKYILLCTCESTNWVVGIPIADEQAETIADALFYKVICVYGTPKAIICDEAPAFTSTLMQSYFHTLNIQPYYISPMNHGSNRTERYIRTLGDIICKYLTDTGDNWPLFVGPVCYAMNTQISLITGYTPYEMIFHTNPPDLMKFDFDPDTMDISVTARKYMHLMKQKSQLIQSLVKERKTREANTQYYRDLLKYPDRKTFKVGDLVYLYHGYGSELTAPSKKLQKNWIGPLKIQSILDDTHYYVSDWMGHLAPIVVHAHRLKPFTMFLGELSKDGLLNIVTRLGELFVKWKEIAGNE